MPWTRWAALASLAALSVGLALSCSVQSSTKTTSAPPDSIARGAYLVSVSGCNDCHTPGAMYGVPDTSRRLSGSDVGWQGPWGVTYARNLTPDSATGLGTWTDSDYVKAFRTGQRPDGSPILPPMPWPNVAQMTDDDLHALIAYLKGLPPVSHRVPERGVPGARVAGPVIPLPAPPEWDVPKAPPAAPQGATAPPAGGTR
jgi:mono/diheme cytochrome c family protein